MAFRNLPEMKPTNKPQFAGYGFQFDDGGASAPVQSVNGKTGAVVLDASDVGAPTAESVTTSFNTVNGKIGDINDNIAPTESTDTASQAYAVGQYFINKDGNLCRVTVDIASGGTITLDTNCVIESVGSSLSSLNSNLTYVSSTNCSRYFNTGCENEPIASRLQGLTSFAQYMRSNFKANQTITKLIRYNSFYSIVIAMYEYSGDIDIIEYDLNRDKKIRLLMNSYSSGDTSVIATYSPS